MNKRQHPYHQYKNDALWSIIDEAVADLVRNGDIDEKTDRSHIVGYVVKTIRESSALHVAHPAKNQRSQNLRGVVA